MAEVSDAANAGTSRSEEPISDFDPKSMRKTKPGLKRLFLTLSVLFSFVLGLISLSLSLSCYRLSHLTCSGFFMQVSPSYGSQSKSTAHLSPSAKSTTSQLGSIPLHCYSPATSKQYSSDSTPNHPLAPTIYNRPFPIESPS